MITHEDIWRALDEIAAQMDMSVSGLARRAGLDPTSFNKSKRISSSGKDRWPSTESVSKVLTVVNISFEEFAVIATGGAQSRRRIPLIGLAQAGDHGYFDDAGFPLGQGWDDVSFPHTEQNATYALEISGDSMLPLYRDGDTVLVAPGQTVRRGDRVVVKTRNGEVMAKELAKLTEREIVLHSINPDFSDRVFAPEHILWMARIVWASQ